jgi:1-acyl-sn-glycerol-3-phosphate acyltransferase
MNSDSKIIALTYYILRTLLKPFIKSLWVKNVTGLSNIPKEGSVIFALNHQSFLDFLTFTVICPRNVHFLAAEKFFDSLFWKPIMILSGQIKVSRESHDKAVVHSIVKRHIEKGMLLAIFPEGTRSHSESEMLKAYTGIAKYALEHRIPIIPVGIKGAHGIFSKGSSRVKFRKSVEINIGEPIIAQEHWGKHLDKSTCTFVTEKVIKKIEILSGKKYNHYEFNH